MYNIVKIKNNSLQIYTLSIAYCTQMSAILTIR